MKDTRPSPAALHNVLAPNRAKHAAERLGAKTGQSIRMDTDHLIVGDEGTPEWAHGRYGTEVEKAMEYRDRMKSNARIILEPRFVQTLVGPAVPRMD